MSSSRRLDISSLLCDVPDPVILAPHLRKQQPGNLQYLGLDALVHAASQERSRLDDRHWHTVLDRSPHTSPTSDDRTDGHSHFTPETRRLSGPGILPLDDRPITNPHQWSPPVVAPPTPPAPPSPELVVASPAVERVIATAVQTVDSTVEVVDTPPAPVKAPPDPPPVLLLSPSSFVFPPDMLSSASPVVPALTPERGSMPPPASTTSARSEISLPKKERAGSVAAAAPRKKKDTVAKAPAKPKQPAKPRAKPKPKPKIVPDAAKSAKLGTALVKKSPGASRSRSTSVMPGGSVGPEGDVKMDVDEAEAEADDDQDDKLYCVCRTRYDEDKVMIACDRCDGWYHTQCVHMPDLEVDLVDQFICPPCIEKNPELSLKTTYKRRCLVGLKHHDPASPEACHKPARGDFSKYCSDECGVNHMEANIEAWTQNGGKKERLWESVKDAEKREGVVVCADAPEDAVVKGEVVKAEVVDAVVKAEVADAKPKKGKVEREVQRLNAQLDEVVKVREEVKKDMEVVLWRRRLVELAAERADKVDQCGWDQRLCFGDEEWADFGAGVLESYEAGDNAMEVDGAAEDEGAWWCVGKKKCERHAGWQALRVKDVAHETETKEESLLKLTTQEREIRKRIEDMVDHGRKSNDSPSTALTEASNIKRRNGEQGKKGKKRKGHC